MYVGFAILYYNKRGYITLQFDRFKEIRLRLLSYLFSRISKVTFSIINCQRGDCSDIKQMREIKFYQRHKAQFYKKHHEKFYFIIRKKGIIKKVFWRNDINCLTIFFRTQSIFFTVAYTLTVIMLELGNIFLITPTYASRSWQ